MTKDEIKKALECCEKYAYCKDCPCYTYCEHELHKGALALITEQEKEIDFQVQDRARLQREIDELEQAHEQRVEEIKRLKAENDSLNKKISELEQDLIHADENVFYRECDVKLAEDKIKKQAQIDVLSKVKERAVGLAAIETYHICNLIDELIKDVNENDLFFDKAESEKKLEGIRNGNKN